MATYDQTYGKGSKYSLGESKYGVTSHKTKTVEDNWICSYWSNINDSNGYRWKVWDRINQTMKEIKDQKNLLEYEGGKYWSQCSRYYNSSIWYYWDKKKETKSKNL